MRGWFLHLLLACSAATWLAACDDGDDCSLPDCECRSDSDCAYLGPGSMCVGTFCTDSPGDAGDLPDSGPRPDAGGVDAGGVDGGGSPMDGAVDAGEGDGGSQDAGSLSDGGPPPSGPSVGYGAMLSSLTAADLSCRGSATAPSPGAVGPRTFALQDFASGDAIPAAAIQVWDNNLPSTDGSCGAGCVATTSDASGLVTASVPASAWLGYRVAAQTASVGGLPVTFLETVQVNAAPGFIAVGVSETTADQIVLLLGTSRTPGTVTVTGRVRDCGDENLANAYVRVFGDAAEIALGSSGPGPRAFYFNGSAFVSGSRVRTHVDGLWGAANVPTPPSGRLRVELWGSVSAGAPAERLGCEVVNAPADGIGIVNVGPLRVDGPAGC